MSDAPNLFPRITRSRPKHNGWRAALLRPGSAEARGSVPPPSIRRGGLTISRDRFRPKAGAVVGQAPGSDLAGLAGGHADDYVAIPGPGVLAVVVAGLGRGVGGRRGPA